MRRDQNVELIALFMYGDWNRILLFKGTPGLGTFMFSSFFKKKSVHWGFSRSSRVMWVL